MSVFKRLVKKLTHKIKQQQNRIQVTAAQFKQKCSNISQQYPALAQSNYFMTHLPLILTPQGILKVLEEKLVFLEKSSNKSVQYQMQLASIILNITEMDGVFYMFIKLWISSFCSFELNKIVQMPNLSDAERSTKIVQFFHKEFFLLNFFVYQLTMYLYEKPLSELKDKDNREIFLLIRNTITQIRQWAQVHQILRKNVKCQTHQFIEEQIQQNMAQLQKVCKLSTIPAPFKQSSNLLNEFSKIPSIQSKLKKAVQLIEAIKQQMNEYRALNGMNGNFIYCADDILSALTYVMWRLMKNIYGACMYTEVILCCEFETINYQQLAVELDRFGDTVRHSFDTIKSVAMIGLLEADKIYSLS